jgi:hypothetical protein
MALRNTAAGADSGIPAFEAPETEDFETAAGGGDGGRTSDRPAAQAEPEPARRSQTTAVAPARSTAVGAARKLVGAFSEFENAIPLEDVAAMGVGAFPRITVDTGGFSEDNKDLGKEIRLELMSWNNRYMIVPGTKDDETKKFVKISYDGETISDTGESVKDYLQHLKVVQEFKDANCKQYIDLWGSLVYASGEIIPEEDRKIVQIQLSPQSVKQFKAFQVQVGFAQAKGVKKDSSVLVLKQERKDLNGDKFGIVKFELLK